MTAPTDTRTERKLEALLAERRRIGRMTAADLREELLRDAAASLNSMKPADMQKSDVMVDVSGIRDPYEGEPQRGWR